MRESASVNASGLGPSHEVVGRCEQEDEQRHGEEQRLECAAPRMIRSQDPPDLKTDEGHEDHEPHDQPRDRRGTREVVEWEQVVKRHEHGSGNGRSKSGDDDVYPRSFGCRIPFLRHVAPRSMSRSEVWRNPASRAT